MPASKMMQASAPRPSSATQSTIEWPPVSSSPSHATRTFTGSAPSAAKQRGGLQEEVEVALVVRDARARRAGRRGSSARTAATPSARAGRAAGRRSGRRRAPSARRLRSSAGISPTTSGAGSAVGTSSASPPAARTKSRTHSPARTTSAACAGSALTLGIRRNSESSSSQSCGISSGIAPVYARVR